MFICVSVCLYMWMQVPKETKEAVDPLKLGLVTGSYELSSVGAGNPA